MGNGVCLMKNLSIEIAPQQSLCVTGVNGSGKTSFFRVLANLWPAHGSHAKIERPLRQHMSLVPQKQYSFDGTLAQQVTYPAVGADYDEARVLAALESAGIGYLVPRYDEGLQTRMRWEDTLSLGEQQRMAFARLYYQQPRFSVLDECSDAVSVDQEALLYQRLADSNITCITISKRLVLPDFHHRELHCGEPNEQ